MGGTGQATSSGGLTLNGGGGGASYTGGAGVSNPSVNDTGNNGSVNGGNGEAVFTWTDPISTDSPSYTTTAGQTLTVTAASGLLSTTAGTSGPAGDTLTASGPASGKTAQGGTVSVNGDGSFSYTPPSSTFTGSDTFGYTVSDGFDYATGTATIQV